MWSAGRGQSRYACKARNFHSHCLEAGKIWLLHTTKHANDEASSAGHCAGDLCPPCRMSVARSRANMQAWFGRRYFRASASCGACLSFHLVRRRFVVCSQSGQVYLRALPYKQQRRIGVVSKSQRARCKATSHRCLLWVKLLARLYSLAGDS